MIVTVGALEARAVGGLAVEIAAAAAAAGVSVQVVATVDEGPRGDAVLLGLARSGIGHSAIVRRGDGGSALEPADVELALRYLPDVRVIVMAAGGGALVAAAVAGAGWSDASLIVIVDDGGAVPAGLPEQAIVLEAPARTASGFAAFVARVAVALDRGDDPRSAVAAAESALGADRISRD